MDIDQGPAAPRLLDDERHVAVDLPCVLCGYNLRTLREYGVCPECGGLVSVSITARHQVGRDWRDGLRRAADTAWGVGAVIVICVVFAIGVGYLTHASDIIALPACSAVLLAVGWVWNLLPLTTKIPDAEGIKVRQAARLIVRGGMLLAISLPMAWLVFTGFNIPRPPNMVAIASVWLFSGIIFAAMPIGAFAHLATAMQYLGRGDVAGACRRMCLLIAAADMVLLVYSQFRIISLPSGVDYEAILGVAVVVIWAVVVVLGIITLNRVAREAEAVP